ncbi:universal stress protein [Natronomonas sp. CBA1123]|jgi:nucleotide-binding universal stress UspA family protein|uniref:universal stress protein n=1 Tax=Natronomonas sp. CBA1123 TaxID=2668070 RepID=UPI0012EA25B9|nr:universal stress protein [Natronomonas sp. CBA1123]MUV85791.1 universal stress protein [Natronomonas sp. CBA1123]
MTTDPEVVVAVGNPDHVEQLVRTAGDLARARDGRIRLVSVVVKSHDSPFEVFSDETIRREYSGDRQALLDRATAAAPSDVPVEAELVVAKSVAAGVLDAVAAPSVEALFVGWHGPSRRSEVVLGTSVDRLLRRAPCDVYVERIGRTADGVDRVLLPVAGGPHVRPAAMAAAAIAASNDATVTTVSVIPPGADREEPSRWLAEAVEAVSGSPGSEVAIETGVRESENVEDALVETAADYDIVVFGATRQSGLRKRLVGSVPRRVADRTDRTVLLARAADAVDGPLGSLIGRLQSRRRGA